MALPNNADSNTNPANNGIEPQIFCLDEGDWNEVLKTLSVDPDDLSKLNTDGFNQLLQDAFANDSFLSGGSVVASIESFNQQNIIQFTGDGNGVQQDQTGQQEPHLSNVNPDFSISVQGQGQSNLSFTVPIWEPVIGVIATASADEVGISSEKTDEAVIEDSVAPAAIKNTRGKRSDSKKPYERKEQEKKPKMHQTPGTNAADQWERREKIKREQREKDEKITRLTAENLELRKLVERLEEEKLSRSETKMLYHQVKWLMPPCVRVVKLGDNLGEAECAALSEQEKAELLQGYCPGGSCHIIIKREPESREISIRTEHAAHSSN